MKKLITIFTVFGLTVLTTSVTYALPSDNFNDNSRNTSLWNLYENNHDNAWLDETNHRLEMRSTGAAGDFRALYVSNGWGLLTTDNFSFKTGFHHSPISEAWSSVTLGLGKGSDLAAIMGNFAIVQAACEDSNPCFHYAYMKDGSNYEFDLPRGSTDGTLYVSYDASADELYLSHTGYGKTNSWDTISGVLKGGWGADVVTLCIAGDAENLALASGDAYLDNFVVDSGTVGPVTAIPAPGAILLGGIGVGLVGWLKRRRVL